MVANTPIISHPYNIGIIRVIVEYYWCWFQVQAVVDYLYHYAQNCDNLIVIEYEVSDLISMAVNLDMEAWHYPIIAKSVVDAIR